MPIGFALRVVVVASSVVATTSPVASQPAADLPIDTFRPAVDSLGYLTINASQTLGHGELSFGLGSLAWGHRVLELGDGSEQLTIDDVITATLIGAVGIHLGPLKFQLGASVPITILNGERPSTGEPDDSFDGQGIGNIGLHLKTRFLSTNRPPRVGVGLVASVFLPTASPAGRFLGDGGLTPQVVGILDKEFGRRGRLRMALNGGIRLRRSTESFTEGGATIAASAEVPFGVGVAFGLKPQKLDLVGEIFGAIPLGEHENYQPLEAIAGLKLYLARNSYLSIGGGRGLVPTKGANPDVRAFIGIVFEPSLGDRDGDGLKDDVDKCPDDPEDFDGFEDADGCPDPDNDRDTIVDEDDRCPNIPEDRDGFQDEDGCPDGDANDRDGDRILDHADKCPDDPEDYDDFEDEDGCPELDNDRDEILDVDDLCPNRPEDVDGFEDEDGCPDLDNDKDRILDSDDKCPVEPETYNAFEDEDGCPDRHGVELHGGIMIVLDPINFEFNSAILTPDSYHVLDAVVATMEANPDLALVEVAGHTDERGNDAYNLDLSDRRAAAVVTYLVAHGVATNRLASQGYGETQPVINAHTEKAWTKNRRVEFLILKRAD